MPRRPSGGPLAALLGALVLCQLLLAPFDDTAWRLFCSACSIGALGLAYWGVAVNRPSRRRGWLLALAGFGFGVVADLARHVESWTGQAQIPAPSDAMSLISYLVLGTGIQVMVRTRGSSSDRAALLDAGILTSTAAALGAVLVVIPLVGHPAVICATAAYHIADMFLIATLAQMPPVASARNGSYWLLLAAFVVTAITNAAWTMSLVLVSEVEIGPRLLSGGTLLAYMLAAAATWSPGMIRLADPSTPPTASPIGRQRMNVIVLAAGVITPPAVLIVDGLTHRAAAWPIIAAAASVSAALILTRIIHLLTFVRAQAAYLEAVARADPLTGAPNRRSWDHELVRACTLARAHDTAVTVAILDLDHFKAFNDAHGHQAGDQLLREAVASWSARLPAGATLARYGGEEFAVLLPGMAAQEAAVAISLLQRSTPRGQTFSAGIAEWSHTTSPRELEAAADEALYGAKHAGRNRIVTASANGGGAAACTALDGE